MNRHVATEIHFAHDVFVDVVDDLDGRFVESETLVLRQIEFYRLVREKNIRRPQGYQK